MYKVFLGLVLLFFVMASYVHAGTSSVTLAWDLSTSPDAIGTRVYMSQAPGQYDRATGRVCEVAAPGTTCTVPNLPDGTYYFVATAYDAAGNESDYSNEVLKAFDATAPGAPRNLQVTLTVRVEVTP